MTSLYHVKILDPACGSGAFPMGMLQQMVHVLRQIDPDNAHWEAFIKTTAGAQAEQAYKKTKDSETRKLQLDEIENAFNLRLANPDYARKLFIIQNCIYGVDIQPIAMQISKLRFFISLISEQNNDSILPLPNLETKFVCANTLIGVDRRGGTISSVEIEDKKEELLDVRKKLFYARTARNKKKFRAEDDAIREELERMIADLSGFGSDDARQLVAWNPYDQNASSPFFDAEWMFGVKDGFDVVIGNPPYVVVTNSSIYLPYFKTARCYEMYAFFFEKGLNLLRSGGVISFITASLYIKGLKFQSLREFLEKESSLVSLKNVGDDVFENVEMPTAVFIASKSKGNWSFADMIPGGRILEKMDSSGTQLQKFTNIQRGFEIGRDLVTVAGKYPFLTGSNVEKYTFRSLSYISEYVYLQFMKDDYYYTGPRLLLRETGSSLTVLYLEDKIYSNRSLYSIKTKDNKFLPKYVLACLNSKALQYYYSSKFRSDTELFPKIRIKQAKQLPIPTATPAQQQPIIALVDKILAAKKANSQADTSAWEREIDGLVYELYGLTEDEVKVVEGGA